MLLNIFWMCAANLNWKLEARRWRLEEGCWKMEAGRGMLENGGWKRDAGR